jgi:uncharacterized protein YndB with AHSA1/START domain
MLASMSVKINAPPETVWPFLVEPEKAKQWFTALNKFEYTSEKHEGVGSTFFWEEEANNRIYNLHFETTEWIENRVFGYRMTSGDFFKSYDERWEIDPTPTGSRFTFNDHIEFPYGPIGQVIGWFAARGAKDTGDEVLSNLKRLAEA